MRISVVGSLLLFALSACQPEHSQVAAPSDRPVPIVSAVPVQASASSETSSPLPQPTTTTLAQVAASPVPLLDSPCLSSQPRPNFEITDVELTYSEESVMGPHAPAAIDPFSEAIDEPGKIKLTIKGDFAREPALSAPAMRFSYEDGLLHQSFTGQAPKVHVTLDKHILLETTEILERQIRVRFSAQFLPDLRLNGLHCLSVTSGSQQASVLVKFADTGGTSTLIEKHQIIEENGKAVALKLTGRGFFLNGGWVEVLLDSIPLALRTTQILTNGEAETWIDLRGFEGFNRPAWHFLQYRTPSGVTFYRFRTAENAQIPIATAVPEPDIGGPTVFRRQFRPQPVTFTRQPDSLIHQASDPASICESGHPWDTCRYLYTDTLNLRFTDQAEGFELMRTKYKARIEERTYPGLDEKKSMIFIRI